MRLVIYGARAFARTLAGVAEDCGYAIAGFIDDVDPAGPGVLGRFDDVVASHRDCGLALGIGYSDLAARWRAWQRVRASGLPTPVLVHPRAYVATSATVGPGCVVMAGAVVDQRTRLGEAVVVWPGACINHDGEIGDNCFLSPSATVCGHVRIGAHSFIGAAAAIADGCRLPEGTRVRMLERCVLNRDR